jgi:hypothetical protein
VTALGGKGNRIPDYQREIAELKAEIRRLWEALRNGPVAPPVQKQMVFSWAGPVTGTRTSGPWLAEANLFITGCTLSQGVAPSSTVTAELLVNGSVAYTYTLAGGSQRGGTTNRININVGDRIQLRVTSGGGEDFTGSVSYVTSDGW